MLRHRRIFSILTLALMCCAAVWCCCWAPAADAVATRVAAASAAPPEHACCRREPAAAAAQTERPGTPTCPADHERPGGGRCPILALRLNSAAPDAPLKAASPFSVHSFAMPPAPVAIVAQYSVRYAADPRLFAHPPALQTLFAQHSLLLC